MKERQVISQPVRPEGSQPVIGVGMLGYSFMGKAHSAAYRQIPHLPGPPTLRPELVSLCGRSEEDVSEAADRYGFASYTTDWRELVADDRIGLFDNSGPNSLHAEPTIAAAERGRHVICEKPLGLNAAQAFEMWGRVEAAGVKHLCGFNYRFVPAIRLAREMIEADQLGEIRHFRGRYLQDWIADPELPKVWRLDKALAGSGALGDLGAHVIDLARYLVGEPTRVAAAATTFVADRPGGQVDVDDASAVVLEFECGAIGTLEASRFAPGRKNALSWEINGSKGTVAFDLERLNELQFYRAELGPREAGFRTILVTEPGHPFISQWWPPGHTIGWDQTFVHELQHLLSAIETGGSVAPHGATFEDGYRVAEVCDAVLRSAASGRREGITFRQLEQSEVL